MYTDQPSIKYNQVYKEVTQSECNIKINNGIKPIESQVIEFFRHRFFLNVLTENIEQKPGNYKKSIRKSCTEKLWWQIKNSVDEFKSLLQPEVYFVNWKLEKEINQYTKACKDKMQIRA